MDIAYQLYSSRNFHPLPDVLARLAALGYRMVEGYDGLYPTPAKAEALSQQLADAGLAMPSGHFGLAMIEDRPGEAIAIARTLGLRQVFVPYLDAEDRPADAEGWRAFGARLEAAGAPLRDAGLTFGWHNHDFEFAALPDGTHPLDLMLENTGLALEFDVAWAHVAGVDPLSVIDRWGDRIVAAHVKDRAPDGEKSEEDGWADIGDGTMPWQSYLDALRAAGCGRAVIEHDNPSDDQRFASASISEVTRLIGDRS